MGAIDQWTGHEATLLQRWLRMSVRQFAARLGVNPATVTNWRKGGRNVVCTHETQQILDRVLDLMPAEDRSDFLARVHQDLAGPQVRALGSGFTVVSHQFLPVHLGLDASALFQIADSHPCGPADLEQRILAVPGTRTSIHIFKFGIAVAHLSEQLTFNSLTELALWRYRSYGQNRDLVRGLLADLVNRQTGGAARGIPVPEYVLSVYELGAHPWHGADLDTALQLLATPSVLVDRTDDSNPVPLGAEVESHRFTERWAHPESVMFRGAVSRGVAGWSGIAYRPEVGERALSIDDIVALQLDTQALWALSAHLLRLVEEGLDPELPTPFGWRWLRGAHSRLVSARPTESAQHRALRAAVIGTNDLSQRLQDAWGALKEVS
ncbi:XRE family transcriptional regulator [Kitasatospora sp. NPDC059146]|uniref:XRE family transcriptional regulator n=1 Tax=unclassified Kitasatospora TaxID=2633591 RepID=UPI00368EE7D1